MVKGKHCGETKIQILQELGYDATQGMILSTIDETGTSKKISDVLDDAQATADMRQAVLKAMTDIRSKAGTSLQNTKVERSCQLCVISCSIYTTQHDVQQWRSVQVCAISPDKPMGKALMSARTDELHLEVIAISKNILKLRILNGASHSDNVCIAFNHR